MKNILLLAMAMLALNAFPQAGETVGFSIKSIELDPVTQKYSTEGIIPIKSLNKELLLEGAYKWLSEIKYVHTLASKGIVLDEAVFNRIIVNQYMITSEKLGSSKLRFKLILEFRDGRFKYQYTDFAYYSQGGKFEFEEYASRKDKEQLVLLWSLCAEAQNYIQASLDELITYLTKYQPDNSW
jgi:hypothetical protein